QGIGRRHPLHPGVLNSVRAGGSMRIIALTDEGGFDERDTLRNLVKAAPAQGYTIDEVRAALAVIDRLSGDGPLRLENAEHAFLCDVLKRQRWTLAAPEIVALFDKVVGAGEVAAA